MIARINKNLYNFQNGRLDKKPQATAVFYYEGWVNDAEQVLGIHRRATVTSYGTWALQQPLSLPAMQQHCLDRKAKGEKFPAHSVHDIDGVEDILEVEKESGSKKTVNFDIRSEENMPTCTCKDWLRFHMPCKHSFAVFQQTGNGSNYHNHTCIVPIYPQIVMHWPSTFTHPQMQKPLNNRQTVLGK